ncbi:MAG: thermonuclease family protein [gamma proteobacterium endosymbiont of Lamellibrachia anaximandri]|nr:thermonuclease family protein [gamma proteobacterium endosymbiont of Lamellibrachia anaximandri]
MNIRLRNFFPLLVAGCLGLNAVAEDGQGYKLLKVEDGDTLVVALAGGPERIQLAGIDAPEDTPNPKLQRDVQRTGLSEQVLLSIGEVSTAHLRHLVSPGQQVMLSGNLDRRDKYGRISLVVMGDQGNSLNEKMVADGFAVVLNRYPLESAFRGRLKKMEGEAFDQKRGLWGEYREIAMRWGNRGE